ncbi:MAG: peroxiredoxin family protein [Gemmataceae bacterium]
MNPFWLASNIALWAVALFLGFLLLGTLRVLGLLRWRLEQLEATMPSRLGRSGLKPGKKAPDFTLPSVSGPQISLHDFAGRRILLAFTQTGCGPCERILPELGRVSNGQLQVLVVNRGKAEETRQWAAKTPVPFPLLHQDGLELSKKYEVFATPFAFLIDEKGVVASKGIISNKRHIAYVLAGAWDEAMNGHAESNASGAEEGALKESILSSNLKEVHNV